MLFRNFSFVLTAVVTLIFWQGPAQAGGPESLLRLSLTKVAGEFQKELAPVAAYAVQQLTFTHVTQLSTHCTYVPEIVDKQLLLHYVEHKPVDQLTAQEQRINELASLVPDELVKKILNQFDRNTKLAFIAIVSSKRTVAIRSLGHSELSIEYLNNSIQMGALLNLLVEFDQWNQNQSGLEIASLTIEDSVLQRQHLRQISGLTRLEELHIVSKLKQNSLIAVKRMTHLKKLNLLGIKGISLTVSDLQGISQLKNLKELLFHNMRITEEAFQKVLLLNQLVALQGLIMPSMKHHTFSEYHQKLAPLFSHLARIRIESASLSSTDVQLLQQMTEMEALELYYVTFGSPNHVFDRIPALNGMTGLTGIEKLTLHTCAISDAELLSMTRRMTELKSIFIAEFSDILELIPHLTAQVIDELKSAHPELSASYETW
jgi:hypothetical protein